MRERLEAAGWTVSVSQPMDGHDFAIWYVERDGAGTYVRSDDAAGVEALAAEPRLDSDVITEYPARRVIGPAEGEGQ